MTSKQRFIAALERRKPDRLPVTTHHVMEYFLRHYMDAISAQEFFDHFRLDPILWTLPTFPYDSADWVIEEEELDEGDYPAKQYHIITPKGDLSMRTESNETTTWLTEHPIKQKRDIDLIGEFAPSPVLDRFELNRQADAFGERGLVRGHIWTFDVFGQPGCWQDAACLYGTQNLIMAAFEDPAWVHDFLHVLQRRKLEGIRTLKGARFDLLELGGGDASSTVISPQIFDEFVAPYDAKLIEAAHKVGQRIVYHTCGGMMPILESIVAMNPDAIETLTPPAMGGDMKLREAKERVGDKVCLIGGFDQFHFFKDCTPEQTRAEVRRCFEEAGQDGGYILATSDHFFDADPKLIHAYADAARECVYT